MPLPLCLLLVWGCGQSVSCVCVPECHHDCHCCLNGCLVCYFFNIFRICPYCLSSILLAVYVCFFWSDFVCPLMRCLLLIPCNGIGLSCYKKCSCLYYFINCLITSVLLNEYCKLTVLHMIMGYIHICHTHAHG